MADTQNQLAVLVKEAGLDESKGHVLTSRFADYFTIAQEWHDKAQALQVTEEDQVELMKAARQGRLFLKDKRVQIEKTRKELKEESLREGQAIDKVANMLKTLIEPTEKFLEEQETFARRAEQARDRERQALIKTRTEILAMCDGKVPDNVEDFTAREFSEYVAVCRQQYEQQQRELAWQQRERDEQLAADAKRAAEEIARLRQEREEEQRRAAEQQRTLQAQLDKEREEKERLRAQEMKRRRAEQEAEQQRALMQAQQQEQQSAKTDQERLIAFAESIEQLQNTTLPCTGTHAQQVMGNVNQLLTRASGFLREQAQQVQKEAA